MSSRAQAARGYRMRPAPRGRGNARRPTRVNWERLGRIALVLVLAAVIVSYVSPALNLFDAWRDSKSETAHLADLERENKRLQERIAELAQPDAAERAARRSGMVRADELAYHARGLRR
ncbi:MAG TPA: septum formation initiator family protein [Solirubrobacterales bacterium]|nr:septum formation initiator family protein [Solirubrobacterales bacterium]